MNFGEVFQIKKKFESGGMGIVYLARHTLWNIDVAIKHPRPEFLRSQNQIDDFLKECATWASLGMDPYVTTCFYSRVLAGMPCVVSEFLPGGSLQDAIHSKDLYKDDENNCLSRLLTIAASSAWGLMRAHQTQLLHCDVKPGNMLLTNYGTAKISDFGLAVSFRPTELEVKAKGLTVAFSSPEQIRGESLTTAADVWSWAGSMLAMFAGGLTWENGAACGAALSQFVDDGAKAYRIPSMPALFAELLSDCLKYSPTERIRNFEQIALRICEIYEEIFEESCPAQRQDIELISADSLNNRAVSHYDLGETSKVHQLLNDALAIDLLHPESNFNLALIGYYSNKNIPESFLLNLKNVTKFEEGEYRPWLYLACLANLTGRPKDAAVYLEKATKIDQFQNAQEIEQMWGLSLDRKSNLVLSPPISGEDLAYDSVRFTRLMTKAEQAISESRIDDAQRYLMMSGDIPNFGRHPRRRRLLEKVQA